MKRGIKASKAVLRAIIRRTGYDICKSEKSKKATLVEKATGNKAGLIVEFLGPSGIGKTNLLQALLTRRTSDRWMTTQEWLVLHGGSNAKSELEGLDRVLMAMRYEAISRQECGIEDKIRLLPFFLQNLQEDVAIRRRGSIDCILRDDGLFHNFGAELHILRDASSVDFARLCCARAFIHCYASDELHLDRLRQRDGKEVTRPQHKTKSDEERLVINRVAAQQMNEFVCSIQKSGGRVEPLDLGESLQVCCSRVEAALDVWLANWDYEIGCWFDRRR
jgi:AAA domain